MIHFDHVTKGFPGHHNALSDITVEIKDGEFVFLIGPSGAGKTTFMRLLIRDLVPNEGNIFIDDWELSKIAKSKVHLLRRKVGMIFQDFKLLTERTVYENIAIGLEILGKDPSEVERGVNDVLALVGLSDKRSAFPQQLSAGQLQRVSIARAIVGGPKILLADEPTGNLDPDTAWEILHILQEINRIGTTVIMATHNVSVVNHMKKRTVSLKQGKIVSDEEKGHYPESHESHKGRTRKDHDAS